MGKETKNACGSNSHLAVEKGGLSIHCFCLFSIFHSESGRQVSLEVLEGQSDVLDPIQSLFFLFFFFFPPPPLQEVIWEY